MPSDVDVISFQFLKPVEVFGTQLTPELLDEYIYSPYTAAARFVPSDEDVIARQLFKPVEVLSIQLTPLSVDKYIFPVLYAAL